MANEKDLKKLKAEEKKAVAGGVVYKSWRLLILCSV